MSETKDENEKKDLLFVYEYFDKIVFNCWSEGELEAWKYRMIVL